MLKEKLVELRLMREAAKVQNRRMRGPRLRKADRDAILAKTAGRCHICGGDIEGAWQADHVMAHSAGGGSMTDNYLAAHRSCNNYRWDYLPAEFEFILKLGVLARTQIENGTKLGEKIEEKFEKVEAARMARRKSAK